jgi:hypothetical protein
LDALKDWIGQRFTWLDANMPGTCVTQSVNPGPGQDRMQIVPNPAGDHIVISGLSNVKGPLVVEIYSLQGQRLQVEPWYIHGQRLDITGLRPGSYFIRVNDGKEILIGKFIKL